MGWEERGNCVVDMAPGRGSNTLEATRSFPSGHPIFSPPMLIDFMPFLLRAPPICLTSGRHKRYDEGLRVLGIAGKGFEGGRRDWQMTLIGKLDLYIKEKKKEGLLLRTQRKRVNISAKKGGFRGSPLEKRKKSVDLGVDLGVDFR